MTGWWRSSRVQVAVGATVPALAVALLLASRVPGALPPLPSFAGSPPAPPAPTATPALVAALSGAELPPARPPVLLPTPRAATLRVYVSGAVVEPGVYTLTADDRIEDALRAAGGALPEADLARLNLAQRVRDEQQVHVPLRGEPPPAPASAAADTAVPLDLNLATAAQLDALPGIGPVIAARILDYRARHGPFASVDDLRTAKLVPAATLERIRDRLTVR